MNGIELDQAIRKIFAEATRATSLSSTVALVELGFSGTIAFQMVCSVILKKEQTSNGR